MVKLGEIVHVVGKVYHMPSVSICQHPPGQPLTTMIDDHHVIAAVKQIVRHFRVLDIAFDAPGADHYHPLVQRGSKAYKADGYAPDAGELPFLTSPPKIQQWPGREGRELLFTV
ncbi:hypothetical protein D3C80_1699690 [compost metagenome]